MMSECYRYKVVLERHRPATRPDVCVFYDEDKTVALNEMAKYVKANGFTISENDGRFSIADVVLVQSSLTGETISETSYHELFDAFGKKVYKNA